MTAEFNPRTGEKTAVSFGGFVTADQTAEHNPRIINASGLIGGFNSAARPPIVTAESRFTKSGESKEKAKGILQERSSRKTKHIIVQARTFPNIFGKRITRHKQTHNKI
jgi:hypothetical protein